VADPLNAMTETNESNNLAALTVTQALVIREQTAGYTVSVVHNPVANVGLLRVRLSRVGANCAAELSLYNALGQQVRSLPLPLRRPG